MSCRGVAGHSQGAAVPRGVVFPPWGQAEPWQPCQGPWDGAGGSAAVGRECCECCVSLAASHAWGRAGLSGEDGDAAVRAGTSQPRSLPCAPASPGGASACGPRRQHRVKMFPRGPFQLLCKLLTGKESDFSCSSPSKELLPALSQLRPVWL